MRPFLLFSLLLLAPLPAQAPARVAPPGGRLVLRAPWGSAPGAFGKEDTGARLGPPAVAAARGRVYILDRIYGRVQVFDGKGKLLQVLPAGSRTVDLLAVDGAGRALVLDAFVKKEVRILEEGKAPRVVPLPAPPRPGLLPSGIFAGKDALLLEWGHALVTSLPCPGIEPLFSQGLLPPPGGFLPGRPTRRGWVQVVRSGKGLSLLLGRRDAPVPEELEFPVKGGVECVLDLESDREGRIAVALFPWDDPFRRIQVMVFSRAGRLLASRRIPGGSITDLMSRFSLSPEGLLYQLRTSEKGVEVLEWDWSRWGRPEVPSKDAPKAPAKEGGR